MKLSKRLSALGEKIPQDLPLPQDFSQLFQTLLRDIDELERQLDILSVAGTELTKLREQTNALEIILEKARELTNADGGTFYMVQENYRDDPYNPGELESKVLKFEVLQNETMNVFLKGARLEAVGLPPVMLVKEGKANTGNVSAYCANTGEIVNIPDVYDAKGFDFSGTKKYDEQTGYRSKSMLVIPLRDHASEIIGVLQLINRRDGKGQVTFFSEADETIVQSLAYQGAVSLNTQKLLREQVNLFNAFVQVLAEGLGEKNPYHYGHISRVAELARDITELIGRWDEGIYGDVIFGKDKVQEMELAGWMHDIGKLTTPETVVSKQIKLQVVTDRFEVIAERFNSKIKDLEIAFLQQKIKALETGASPAEIKKLERNKNQAVKEISQRLAVLNASNVGGEFLADEKAAVIRACHQDMHMQHFDFTIGEVAGQPQITGVKKQKAKKTPLINQEEEELLLIKKGTLSAAERKIINDHADRSWNWLFKLPFPRSMMKLPLYAAAHHETLNGTGYPIGLSAHQLPLESRVMAVVDVFEALTAADRPYKKPMTLSKAFEILGFMVKDQHLDPEVLRIFIKSGLYQQFADKHLLPEQKDSFDPDAWLERFYPKDFQDSLPNQNRRGKTQA